MCRGDAQDLLIPLEYPSEQKLKLQGEASQTECQHAPNINLENECQRMRCRRMLQVDPKGASKDC